MSSTLCTVIDRCLVILISSFEILLGVRRERERETLRGSTREERETLTALKNEKTKARGAVHGVSRGESNGKRYRFCRTGTNSVDCVPAGKWLVQHGCNRVCLQ